MSLTKNKAFTLGELAKIALGAAELTNDHFSVLHSLLLILLEKLNCHNETVRFNGFLAKCLKDLLNAHPNGPQYSFQVEQINRLNKKFELLEELERRAQAIDAKMRKHCDEIRRCNKTNAFAANKWGFYSSSSEDLCTLYSDYNKQFCLLSCNTNFNIELRKRVYPLISERLTEFENKFDSIQSKLAIRTRKIENISAATDCIEFIIHDIEAVRSSLQQNKENLREAMLEAQDMLDCKLHRQAFKTLKIYLEKHFGAIRDFLSTSKKCKCPPAMPLPINDKKTCLSCSRQQKLEAKKLFKTLIPADEENECFCGRSLKQSSILKKLDEISSSCHILSVPGVPTKRTGKKEKKYLKLLRAEVPQYGSPTGRDSTDS